MPKEFSDACQHAFVLLRKCDAESPEWVGEDSSNLAVQVVAPYSSARGIS